MKEPRNNRRAVSIIELIISIILLSVIVLALASIDLFSRHHVLTSDLRARMQNQMYYAIEHMSRRIPQAIGNEYINGQNQVIDIIDDTTANDRERIKIYTDASGDGVRQDIGNPGVTDDHWIAYRFFDSTGPSNDRYKIQYCSYCRQKKCNNCFSADGWVTIADNIIDFDLEKPTIGGGNDTLTNNYVTIAITSCFDPANAITSAACGTLDNPQFSVKSSIKLPSVSVQ